MKAQSPSQSGASAPRSTRSRSGVPAAGTTSTTPRRAIVKVATAADSATVIEREVTVGVASRVNAEILSGLNEGERIVAGIKVTEASRTAAQSRGATPAFGPPGATGAPVGTGAGFRR